MVNLLSLGSIGAVGARLLAELWLSRVGFGRFVVAVVRVEAVVKVLTRPLDQGRWLDLGRANTHLIELILSLLSLLCGLRHWGSVLVWVGWLLLDWHRWPGSCSGVLLL